MIGPLFVCSDQEQKILAKLRSTGSWSDAAMVAGGADAGWDNAAVTHLYRQYLQQRIAAGDDPHQIAELQEGYLDWLDAIIDKYGGPAVMGDQKAARLVLATITALARLRQLFRAERQSPPASPASDAVKDSRTTREQLVAEYLLLEKACTKLGTTVPENVTLVYRRRLAELTDEE